MAFLQFNTNSTKETMNNTNDTTENTTTIPPHHFRRVMVKTSRWVEVRIPQGDIDEVGGDINELELEEYSVEEDEGTFEWEEEFNILDYDAAVDGE